MFPSLGIDTWKEETLSVLAAKILNISPKPFILIDGKGGSGKTSFALKLANIFSANIVATDDICWWADPIHWDDEMLNGIVKPWFNGKKIAYTPSGWIKKNRPGCIKVNPNKALIIEGSGACRNTLRKMATYSVWIDTEPDVCRLRVIQRDLANGENGGTLKSVTEFTDWWDSVVDPFLLKEKAWEYANVIINGSHSDLSYTTLLIHHPDNRINYS
jgi:uridine kinase